MWQRMGEGSGAAVGPRAGQEEAETFGGGGNRTKPPATIHFVGEQQLSMALGVGVNDLFARCVGDAANGCWAGHDDKLLPARLTTTHVRAGSSG